jgi:hypothetical protein
LRKLPREYISQTCIASIEEADENFNNEEMEEDG